MKHFEYKPAKKLDINNRINRPREFKAGELLTGYVMGELASDLEERYAKALYKNPRVIGFDFQPSFAAGRNMPGEIRLDFMVNAMTLYPIQIDGAFAHKTAGQRAEDAEKDAILNDILQGSGAMPVKRVPGQYLQTQEDADALVGEMF